MAESLGVWIGDGEGELGEGTLSSFEGCCPPWTERNTYSPCRSEKRKKCSFETFEGSNWLKHLMFSHQFQWVKQVAKQRRQEHKLSEHQKWSLPWGPLKALLWSLYRLGLAWIKKSFWCIPNCQGHHLCGRWGDWSGLDWPLLCCCSFWWPAGGSWS